MVPESADLKHVPAGPRANAAELTAHCSGEHICQLHGSSFKESMPLDTLVLRHEA